MNIIVRQQKGGFVARFGDNPNFETPFAKPAKTREGAIGNLVERHKRRLGIRRVRWDLKDPWTINYVAGRSNRTLKKPGINFADLPKALNPQEAKLIRIEDIQPFVPGMFFSTLIRLVYEIRENITRISLGDLCLRTEDEIISLVKHSSPRCFGKKNLGYLRQLLAHYGLSLKIEVPELETPTTG